MAKKKSKLSEWKPKLVRGVHRTWDNRGTTNWTYYVKFENGDEGETNKQTQNPDWVIGTEYEYNYVEQTFDWGSVWKVIGMVDPIKEAEYKAKQSDGKSPVKKGYTRKGGGGYHMSEEEQKEIMMQVCMIAANDTLVKIQADYKDVVTAYMNWLMKHCFGGEYKAIAVQGILKITAHYYHELPIKDLPTPNLSVEQVLERAELSLKALNSARKWKKESPPQNSSENIESKNQEKENQEQSNVSQKESISDQKKTESPEPELDPEPPFMKIT